VAKRLGHAELARLFRETAAQETEHAFAHFRLLHPELVLDDADSLSGKRRQALISRCLKLAIEGETYEYTTIVSGVRGASTGQPRRWRRGGVQGPNR